MRLRKPIRTLIALPGAALLTLGWLCSGSAGLRAATIHMGPGTVTASVWLLPKKGETVLLVTLDKSGPIKTTVRADTQIEGICMHCDIKMQCRAADLEKKCGTCPCGFSNFACLAARAPSANTWQAMLEALPQGTQLRVEYADPEQPNNGIRRLVVDRHAVLLPVEGLSGATPQQLQDLRKCVGAARIELNPHCDRLQLSLKANWTTDKVARLEKALATLDARIAPVPSEAATPQAQPILP